MRILHFIPASDEQSNHRKRNCPCNPKVIHGHRYNDIDCMAIQHFYTDGSEEIHEALTELNIKSEKPSYIVIE